MSGSLRYGLALLFRIFIGRSLHLGVFVPHGTAAVATESESTRDSACSGCGFELVQGRKSIFFWGGLLSLSGKCSGHRHHKQSAGKSKDRRAVISHGVSAKKARRRELSAKKRVSLRSEITAYIIREHPTHDL